nr:putative cupredoxin [Tanacetum cinerariifolium]
MILNVTASRYHPPTIASAPNYDPYHHAVAPAPSQGAGPGTSMETGLAVSVSASIMAYAVALAVGGAVGWRLPAANETELYNVWASRRRFHIGDSLRFRYTDSVVMVEKWGFFHCDASQPIVYYNTGDTVVNLDKVGVFYFISGSEERCNKGQKMILNVTASRYHPPTIASAPNYDPYHHAKMILNVTASRYHPPTIASAPKYDPYHHAVAPSPFQGAGPGTSLETGLAVSVSASIMAYAIALAGLGLCLEYLVGGAVGWRLPAANETELYNVWASRRRFHIGDSLRFRYTDSVVMVEKWGFFHCDASQPIVYYNTGDTVVNLDKVGVFYFISGSEERGLGLCLVQT